ncbi:AAC(3) family N-acetyltransferase [Stutzerimonas xanthomarina]|uniref:AAC(3) family N-acetyltransferase n=1 Tax=Stutzerimonas xanthomarina TaxID=271420 RepID=UPI003AA7ED0B
MRILSVLKSSPLYAMLRSLKHKAHRLLKGPKGRKLTINETREILEADLGLCAGDSVLIHCGFGYLNAEYSPDELIILLKDIVGPTGNILMPFYPPGLSMDWAKSGRAFKCQSVKGSTGILSQAFSRCEGVRISAHPIKSLIAWGANADDLVSEHHHSIYPFDMASPYCKLACITGSKSIGLGVKNCAMVHCAEDLYEERKEYLYAAQTFELKFSNQNQNLNIKTFVHRHDLSATTIPVSEFISNTARDILIEHYHGCIYFYSVSNEDLMVRCRELFSSDVSRKQ